MKLSKQQKQQINKIGKKHNLRYIIIHGSYATDQQKQGSDLDVAVYGKEIIEFDKLLEIFEDLAQVFGNNKERELDVKSLHNICPLFRYEVARDGYLIYGEQDDYDEFCIYAYKDYIESKSLFRLRDILIRKRQKHLNKILSPNYA